VTRAGGGGRVHECRIKSCAFCAKGLRKCANRGGVLAVFLYLDVRKSHFNVVEVNTTMVEMCTVMIRFDTAMHFLQAVDTNDSVMQDACELQKSTWNIQKESLTSIQSFRARH